MRQLKFDLNETVKIIVGGLKGFYGTVYSIHIMEGSVKYNLLHIGKGPKVLREVLTYQENELEKLVN